MGLGLLCQERESRRAAASPSLPLFSQCQPGSGRFCHGRRRCVSRRVGGRSKEGMIARKSRNDDVLPFSRLLFREKRKYKTTRQQDYEIKISPRAKHDKKPEHTNDNARKQKTKLHLGRARSPSPSLKPKHKLSGIPVMTIIYTFLKERYVVQFDSRCRRLSLRHRGAFPCLFTLYPLPLPLPSVRGA